MAKNSLDKILIALGLIAVIAVVLAINPSLLSSIQPQQNSAACQPIQPNSMNAYFCPQDNCSEKLIAQFDSAKTKIHAAIFSFTLDSIGDSLVRAKERGVEVKVVMEKQQLSQYDESKKLKNAGIEAKIDSNPSYMHNKFAIIDDEIVATGSFNWSKNADEENNENLIIVNSTELAKKYEIDFEEIFEAGTNQ